MNKLAAFLLILIIAPILGATYGIVHDQLTFTISPEYYTKFKFVQFDLYNWGMEQNIGSDEWPEIQLDNPRYGASIVGVLASWWVGLIIGIVLGLLGFLHTNGKRMLKITLQAFLITIGIALITGIIGLGYGKLVLANSSPTWFIPEHVINQSNFIAVGSMHNFSYIGGLIGLIGGVIFSIRRKDS